MNLEHLITLHVERFASAAEAIQHTYAAGRGEAISLGGTYYVVTALDAQRLETAGVPFSYIYDVEGRTVSVPINKEKGGGA